MRLHHLAWTLLSQLVQGGLASETVPQKAPVVATPTRIAATTVPANEHRRYARKTGRGKGLLRAEKIIDRHECSDHNRKSTNGSGPSARRREQIVQKPLRQVPGVDHSTGTTTSLAATTVGLESQVTLTADRVGKNKESCSADTCTPRSGTQEDSAKGQVPGLTAGRLLDDIRSLEDGLMLAATKDSLLNHSDGILSFLSPKDTASLLQVSKLHSQKDALGAAAATAAIAQDQKNRMVEARTESCEDLFLEVLRERVGQRKPNYYWNQETDGGFDFLRKFQRVVEFPDNKREPPSQTEWSVLLLMTMAAETCNPATWHGFTDNVKGNLRSRYGPQNLRHGCHAADRDFFREVLDFFHEGVADAASGPM
ncbi:unnamed protein product, partial [Amoebophrya sp. A120]|eukprot:GSA120T00025944001.1